MRDVLRLARGVDDEKQAIFAGLFRRQSRRHQVVEDAAFSIEKLRVARAVFASPTMSAASSVSSAAAAPRLQNHLPHVGHVEEASALARPLVLAHDAERVLNRHVVAGERRHARAKRDVHRVERGKGEVFCTWIWIRHQVARARLEAANRQGSANAKACDRAPSVPGPERFPALLLQGRSAVTPVGGSAPRERKPLSRVSSRCGPFA